MSRRWAGAILAMIFAGSAGSGLLAVRSEPQASDAPKQSSEAVATEALNSGLKRLEKADQIALKNPKQARGEYEAALKDFELAPASSKAIEYRAEAYLRLNRLNDAKQAYMHLFVHDRTASNVLMKAMKAWVEKHRSQPAGVDAKTVHAFDTWVRERDTLAASVVNLGHNSPDWK
jgi:hypothetical protein